MSEQNLNIDAVTNRLSSPAFYGKNMKDVTSTAQKKFMDIQNPENPMQTSGIYSANKELSKQDNEILNEILSAIKEAQGTKETEETQDTEEKAVNHENIMNIDAESEELKDYSGDELFDIYNSYVQNNSDLIGYIKGKNGEKEEIRDWHGDNINYSVENTLIVKLLTNASEEQIKDFFEAYENTYGHKFSGDLNWLRCANITDTECQAFLATVQRYPDLFPEGIYKYGWLYA